VINKLVISSKLCTMDKYSKKKSSLEQSSTINPQTLDECGSIKLGPSLKKKKKF
jgi:hypothetical protein